MTRQRQHTLRSLLQEASDSTLLRLGALVVVLGAVPFYFLSRVLAALGA